MLWIFNPPEPRCWPTQAGLPRKGVSAGDVISVAGHWRIDVTFKPHDFSIYPEAAGEHVLSRFLNLKWARHPFHLPDLFPEGLDFESHPEGIGYWDAVTKTDDEQTMKWRMAFNWPWTRWRALAGTGNGLTRRWTIWYGPAFWLSPLAEAEGSPGQGDGRTMTFQEWLVEEGYIDDESQFDVFWSILDDDLRQMLLDLYNDSTTPPPPPDPPPPEFDGWLDANGYPPREAFDSQPDIFSALVNQWWIENLQGGPTGMNLAIPLYTSDDVDTVRNLFDGLRPVTLEKHPIGNNVLPGIFDFPEFPDTLTVEPWWP